VFFFLGETLSRSGPPCLSRYAVASLCDGFASPASTRQGSAPIEEDGPEQDSGFPVKQSRSSAAEFTTNARHGSLGGTSAQSGRPPVPVR